MEPSYIVRDSPVYCLMFERVLVSLFSAHSFYYLLLDSLDRCTQMSSSSRNDLPYLTSPIRMNWLKEIGLGLLFPEH